MKRLALAITLITSAALLSGCIIVPHRHGGHRGYDRQYQEGGYYQGEGQYQDRGQYQGGGYYRGGVWIHGESRPRRRD